MIPPATAHAKASVHLERLGPLLREAGRIWRAAVRWWMMGARATLPAIWFDPLFARRNSLLLLEREEDGVRGHLVAGETRASVYVPDAARCLSALDDWLQTIGRSRAELRLGLVLDRAHCLKRSFVIPEAAVGSLAGLLEQEVLRRTPFELDEIWQGAKLTRRTADTRTVSQWIVRRDRARDAMAAFGVAEGDVHFLSTGAIDHADAAIIALRDADRVGARPAFRGLRIATALAAATTGLAVAAWGGHEDAVLDELANRVETARAATRADMGDPAAVSALLLRKAEPGTVRVWAELSRLLPDDTYVKTMRIVDGGITLTGVSANAVDLVRIVDKSPLFTHATLVGAIEPIAAEGKDRFVLAFDLRGRRPIRGGSSRSSAALLAGDQP